MMHFLKEVYKVFWFYQSYWHISQPCPSHIQFLKALSPLKAWHSIRTHSVRILDFLTLACLQMAEAILLSIICGDDLLVFAARLKRSLGLPALQGPPIQSLQDYGVEGMTVLQAGLGQMPPEVSSSFKVISPLHTRKDLIHHSPNFMTVL